MKGLEISISGPSKSPNGFNRESLPRGLALFFGSFALLNVLGSLRVAHFDANLWWIDLRWLPAILVNGFLSLAAIGLVGFGFRPPHSHWRRWLTLISAGALGAVCLLNAAAFFVLLARRKVASSVPLPLSLLVAASMLLIVRAVWPRPSAD